MAKEMKMSDIEFDDVFTAIIEEAADAMIAEMQAEDEAEEQALEV